MWTPWTLAAATRSTIVGTGVSDAGADSRPACRALGLEIESRGPTATTTLALPPTGANPPKLSRSMVDAPREVNRRVALGTPSAGSE